MTPNAPQSQWTLRFESRPLLANEARRLHHQQLAKQVRVWREAFCWLARQQRIPRLEAASIVVRHEVRNRRALCDVGAAFPSIKGLVDGVCDAGVLVNDSPAHLRRLVLEAPVVTGVDALEVIVAPWVEAAA